MELDRYFNFHIITLRFFVHYTQQFICKTPNVILICAFKNSSCFPVLYPDPHKLWHSCHIANMLQLNRSLGTPVISQERKKLNRISLYVSRSMQHMHDGNVEGGCIHLLIRFSSKHACLVLYSFSFSW